MRCLLLLLGLLLGVARAGAQPSATTLRLSAWLPDLPVVWTHPTSGAQPARVGDLLLVIEPGGKALSALSAVDGQPRWTRRAPAGVLLSSVQARGELLLAQGATDSDTVLLRYDHAGALRWRFQSAAALDLRGEDTRGALPLLNRGRCQLLVLDTESGRLRPNEQSFTGNHIERFGLRGGPMTSTCEVTTTLHLLQRGLALGSDYRGRVTALRAVDAQGETRWQVPGRFFRLVQRDAQAAVFFSYDSGGATQLHRVELATGKVLWQRGGGTSCAEDRRSRHPLVLGAAGAPTAVLLQDCQQAQLVALPSGEVRWRRPTQGAVALLLPDAHGEEFQLGQGSAPALAWFTAEGASAGTAVLPADARALVGVPGGAVVHSGGLDRVWLVRPGGAVPWRYEGDFGNAFRVDDHFVIIPSGAQTSQVLIEIASGRAYRLPLGSPFVLGRVAAEPSLWLTTRGQPAAVVAVRLPSP